MKPEFKEEKEDEDPFCPGVPATCDILKTMAGQALYAVDTLLMDRKRDWNYRTISLRHSHLINSVTIEPREGCMCCGWVKEGSSSESDR